MSAESVGAVISAVKGLCVCSGAARRFCLRTLYRFALLVNDTEVKLPKGNDTLFVQFAKGSVQFSNKAHVYTAVFSGSVYLPHVGHKRENFIVKRP